MPPACERGSTRGSATADEHQLRSGVDRARLAFEASCLAGVLHEIRGSQLVRLGVAGDARAYRCRNQRRRACAVEPEGSAGDAVTCYCIGDGAGTDRPAAGVAGGGPLFSRSL